VINDDCYVHVSVDSTYDEFKNMVVGEGMSLSLSFLLILTTYVSKAD